MKFRAARRAIAMFLSVSMILNSGITGFAGDMQTEIQSETAGKSEAEKAPDVSAAETSAVEAAVQASEVPAADPAPAPTAEAAVPVTEAPSTEAAAPETETPVTEVSVPDAADATKTEPKTKENTADDADDTAKAADEVNLKETPAYSGEEGKSENTEDDLSAENPENTPEEQAENRQTVTEQKVTVTYAASKGGSVDREKETVDLSAENTFIKGATATSDAGYTFRNWTDANGNVVSEAAEFIPGADLLSVGRENQFTANFEIYPAFSFQQTMNDGVTVSVDAPEGAFPEDTTMQVEYADRAASIEAILYKLGYGEAAEEISKDDLSHWMAAYNITFFSNGEKIQPTTKVNITYDNVNIDKKNAFGVDSFDVWHVKAQEAEKAVIIDQTNDRVTFEADNFSSYIALGAYKQSSSKGVRKAAPSGADWVTYDTFGGERHVYVKNRLTNGLSFLFGHALGDITSATVIDLSDAYKFVKEPVIPLADGDALAVADDAAFSGEVALELPYKAMLYSVEAASNNAQVQQALNTPVNGTAYKYLSYTPAGSAAEHMDFVIQLTDGMKIDELIFEDNSDLFNISLLSGGEGKSTAVIRFQVRNGRYTQYVDASCLSTYEALEAAYPIDRDKSFNIQLKYSGTASKGSRPSDYSVNSYFDSSKDPSYDKTNSTIRFGGHAIFSAETSAEQEDTVLAEAAYAAYYGFVSDSDAELPENVQKLLPMPEAFGEKENFSPITPEEWKTGIQDPTEGKWQFVGWDPEQAKVDGKSVKFTGTWRYINGTAVTYVFRSWDEEHPLEQMVNDEKIVSEDGEEYIAVYGEPFIPSPSLGRTVPSEDSEGIWYLSEWKIENSGGEVELGEDGSYIPSKETDESGLTVTAIWKYADIEDGYWHVNGNAPKPYVGTNPETDVEYWTEFVNALKAMTAGDTMYISGSIPEGNTFTVSKGKLVIENDVTMTGIGIGTAVTLEKETKMSCSRGKSLNISGYATGILIQSGAQLNDGNYVLDGNDYAFNLQGTIKGTNRSKLVITADTTTAAGHGFTYKNGVTFENVTITVKGLTGSTANGGGYNYGGHPGLILNNATMDTEGMRFNISGDQVLQMTNSELRTRGKWVKENYKYDAFGAIDWAHVELDNSTLTVDGGKLTLNAAPASGHPNGGIVFKNGSAVNVKNSTDGGLNINWGGKVSFIDSELSASGITSSPLFVVGAKSESLLLFDGNSVINTPASSQYDNGGYQTENVSLYIVTGGSHRIKWTNGSVSGYKTVPNNGSEHGSEALTYFKLANPDSVNELDVVDINGEHYTYSVANASSDGEKYVWTPKAEVVIHAQDSDGLPKSATINGEKSLSYTTIRGGRIIDVAAINTAAAKSFSESDLNLVAQAKRVVGWKYTTDGGETYKPIGEQLGEEDLGAFSAAESYELLRNLHCDGKQVDIYPIYRNNGYTAKYEYVSDVEGDVVLSDGYLPKAVLDTLPEEHNIYEEETLVLPVPEDYEDADGYWTFENWTVDGEEKTELVVGSGDLELVGNWHFDPKIYQVSIEWKDSFGNTIDIDEILDLADIVDEKLQKTAHNGEILLPDQPEEEEVTAGNRIYSFAGYKVGNAVVGANGYKVNGSDVRIVGTWTTEKTKYNIYISSERYVTFKDNSASFSLTEQTAYEKTKLSNTGRQTAKQFVVGDAVDFKALFSTAQNAGTNGEYRLLYAFLTDGPKSGSSNVFRMYTGTSGCSTTYNSEAASRQLLENNFVLTQEIAALARTGSAYNDLYITPVWLWVPSGSTWTLTYELEGDVPEGCTAPETAEGLADKTAEILAQPEQTTILAGEGTWKWNGWKQGGAVVTSVTMNTDITVTGSWSYIPKAASVQFEWDGDAPASVSLPSTVTKSEPGTVDFSNRPRENRRTVLDEETDAVYTFEKWTVDGQETISVDVTAEDISAENTITVKGSWNAEKNEYTVRWVNTDSEETLLNEKSGLVKDDEPSYDGEEPVREEDVAGTYAFKGWKLDGEGEVLQEALPVNRSQADADRVITYKAYYDTDLKKYPVDYAFVSSSAGRTLPDTVMELLPATDKDGVDYGTVITPEPEKGRKVQDEHGIWTFEGYKTGIDGDIVTEAVLDENGLTFTGSWNYGANQVTLKYQFASVNEEKYPLGEERAVKDLLPETENIGENEEHLLVLLTDEEGKLLQTVEGIGGAWTFMGWYPDGASPEDEGAQPIASVTPGAEGAVVTGYWEFTPNDYEVTYSFISGTDGLDLDEAVYSKLPDTDKAFFRDHVEPVELKDADRAVTAEFGRWLFREWKVKDSDGELKDIADAGTVMTAEGVEFAGVWEYVNDTHEVSYTFVNVNTNDNDPAQNNDLPAEVTGLLEDLKKLSTKVQSEEAAEEAEIGTFDDGTLVNYIDRLTRKRVDVEGGTWLYVGWKYRMEGEATATELLEVPVEGVVLNDADLVFAVEWQFISDDTETVDITLHGNGGEDAAGNSEINKLLVPTSISRNDKVLDNPFTNGEKRFIGWAAAPLSGDTGYRFVYKEGEAFDFAHPRMDLYSEEDRTASASLLDLFTLTAYADENLKLYGDLWAVWAEPGEGLQSTEELPADILAATKLTGSTPDTQHEEALIVNKDEKVMLTSGLDSSSVKTQIQTIYEYYEGQRKAGLPMGAIELSDVESTFTAKIHTAGIALPEDDQFELGFLKSGSYGDTDAQYVMDISREGDDVTVTMTLANVDRLTTFEALYDMVHERMSDMLSLTINDAQIERSGGYARVTATVEGNMKANATLASVDGEGNVTGYTTIPFSFKWTARQDASKDDSTNQGPISLTFQVVPEVELLGDILVADTGKTAFDTEHDQVYVTKAGDELDYQATLDVTPIQDQMRAIEGDYDEADGRFGEIVFVDGKGVECTFIVKITAPNGLILPTNLDVYDLDTDKFTISDRSVISGSQATLYIDFTEPVTTYADLHRAIVDETPETLHLTIPGVQVSASALGMPLTVSGTIDGAFKATVKLDGIEIPFAFTWNGKQTPDGLDYVLTDDSAADKDKIQLTVVTYGQPMTYELPGDIAVKGAAGEFTTEHDHVFLTKPGENLTFASSLNITSIQDVMRSIEDDNGKADQTAIKLSQVKSTFIVTMTVPAGIKFPDAEEGNYVLGSLDGTDYNGENGSPFVITAVEPSAGALAGTGGNVVVIMELEDADQITTYTDLANKIQNETPAVLTLTVNNASVSSDAAKGAKLTVEGSVSGEMSAIASINRTLKPFAFKWSSVQDKAVPVIGNGTDAVLCTNGSDYNEKIQLTMTTLPDPVNVELPGDIAVRGAEDDAFNTEHDYVYLTEPGEELTFGATLRVKPIKDQMISIEGQPDYEGVDQDHIILSDVTSTFTVTMDIPEGLVFPTDTAAYSLDYLDDSGDYAAKSSDIPFRITKVEQSGSQIVVTMELKDAENITVYKTLHDMIAVKCPDVLSMTVKAQVAENIAKGEQITVKGEVSGEMSAVAMSHLGRNIAPFSFIWSSIQDDEVPAGIGNGTDSILGEYDKKIWLTLNTYPEPQEVELPGDLQLMDSEEEDAFDTENASVYRTREGAVLDYAATLNVSEIFEQMRDNEELQAEAGGKTLDELKEMFEDIKLYDLNSSFTVVLETPEELLLPADLSKYALINAKKGKFVIDTANSSASAHRTVLKMVYDVDHTITDYAELVYDIQSQVDDLLQLNITGVKVADKVSSRYLTMKGTVSGDFRSIAVKGNTTIPFAFSWKGTQDTSVITGNYKNDTGDGTDYILQNGLTDEADQTKIWATVEVYRDINVIKIWEDEEDKDGLRPDSLTINLVAAADGKTAQIYGSRTLTEADKDENGNWTCTFENLPAADADGRGLTYTVEEVFPEGWASSDNGKSWIRDGEERTKYTGTSASVTKDGVTTITITNTHERIKSILTVTKKLTVTESDAVRDLTLEEGTFYVALFSDANGTTRISDVKEITFRNQSASSVTFTDLASGDTCYLFETDSEGTVQGYSRWKDTSYYPLYENGQAVTIASDGENTVTFENRFLMTPIDGSVETETDPETETKPETEKETENMTEKATEKLTEKETSTESETETEKKPDVKAVKTGDDTPIRLYLFLMLAAFTAMAGTGAVVTRRRKRR